MKSSSEEEEDLRILVDERLDSSWQCEIAAQKTNQTLGCLKRRVASRVRKMILPLGAGSLRDQVEWMQRRARKMI